MPSISRSNQVALAVAATRASTKEWQFVNVNDPKKNLDKGVISVVRAHAMRSVRRQQRLKLTTEYQKSLKTEVSTSTHAHPKVAAEHLMPIAPNDESVDDEADTDWSREMSSGFELVDLGQMTSKNEAKLATGSDEDARRPDYWQNYGEDEGQALTRLALGTRHAGIPKSMVRDGVFDPFNTMPIASCADYNSHVLNHCKHLLLQRFPVWSRAQRFLAFSDYSSLVIQSLPAWLSIVYQSTRIKVRIPSQRFGFPMLFRTQRFSSPP